MQSFGWRNQSRAELHLDQNQTVYALIDEQKRSDFGKDRSPVSPREDGISQLSCEVFRADPHRFVRCHLPVVARTDVENQIHFDDNRPLATA